MFFEKNYGKILLGMCGSLLLLGAITIGSAAYNLSTPTPQIITKKNKKKDENNEKDEYIEKNHQRI